MSMLSPLPNHRAGLVAAVAVTVVVQNPIEERVAATFLQELQRSVARDGRAAAESGGPLDSRARDGARTWIGRIPDDGDYRIDVVRLAAAGASLLPYVLAISGR
jgi:hypothetical protein